MRLKRQLDALHIKVLLRPRFYGLSGKAYAAAIIKKLDGAQSEMKMIYGLYIAIALLIIMGVWDFKQGVERSAICEVLVDGNQAGAGEGVSTTEERAAEIKKCMAEKAWQ